MFSLWTLGKPNSLIEVPPTNTRTDTLTFHKRTKWIRRPKQKAHRRECMCAMSSLSWRMGDPHMLPSRCAGLFFFAFIVRRCKRCSLLARVCIFVTWRDFEMNFNLVEWVCCFFCWFLSDGNRLFCKHVLLRAEVGWIKYVCLSSAFTGSRRRRSPVTKHVVNYLFNQQTIYVACVHDLEPYIACLPHLVGHPQSTCVWITQRLPQVACQVCRRQRYRQLQALKSLVFRPVCLHIIVLAYGTHISPLRANAFERTYNSFLCSVCELLVCCCWVGFSLCETFKR